MNVPVWAIGLWSLVRVDMFLTPIATPLDFMWSGGSGAERYEVPRYEGFWQACPDNAACYEFQLHLQNIPLCMHYDRIEFVRDDGIELAFESTDTILDGKRTWTASVKRGAAGFGVTFKARAIYACGMT